MKKIIVGILICHVVLLAYAPTTEAAFTYEGVRLRGGPTFGQGKVEIFRTPENEPGQWGAVCDDHWTLTEATVVCKQLGFEGALKALKNSHYGEARGGIWLKSVACVGTESSITDCSHKQISEDIRYYAHVDEVNECSYGNQAAVVCKEPENPEAKKVKLDFIIPVVSSLVIVETEGGWHPVCWDAWSNKEAAVACRQSKNNFAKITKPVTRTDLTQTYHSAIREISCSSYEGSLQQCDMVVGGPCKQYATVDCSDYAPDISLNITDLEESIEIKEKKESRMTCAMEEGCMSGHMTNEELGNSKEKRKLLVFTSNVQNFGNADFRPPHTSKWHYHACHKHLHSIVNFAKYELRSQDGTVVEVGHKVSFCLRDNACVDNSKKHYKCRKLPGGDQGISVGYSDHYTSKLDCQWIDVTKVQPGLYTLEIQSNPNLGVSEQDYTNNLVICDVNLTQDAASGSNCRFPVDFERPG